MVLCDNLHDPRLVVKDFGHSCFCFVQLINHELTPLDVALKDRRIKIDNASSSFIVNTLPLILLGK